MKDQTLSHTTCSCATIRKPNIKWSPKLNMVCFRNNPMKCSMFDWAISLPSDLLSPQDTSTPQYWCTPCGKDSSALIRGASAQASGCLLWPSTSSASPSVFSWGFPHPWCRMTTAGCYCLPLWFQECSCTKFNLIRSGIPKNLQNCNSPVGCLCTCLRTFTTLLSQCHPLMVWLSSLSSLEWQLFRLLVRDWFTEQLFGHENKYRQWVWLSSLTKVTPWTKCVEG